MGICTTLWPSNGARFPLQVQHMSDTEFQAKSFCSRDKSWYVWHIPAELSKKPIGRQRPVSVYILVAYAGRTGNQRPWWCTKSASPYKQRKTQSPVSNSPGFSVALRRLQCASLRIGKTKNQLEDFMRVSHQLEKLERRKLCAPDSQYYRKCLDCW